MELRKILVVSWGTSIGGVEKSLIEFLKFLSEEHCAVDLLTVHGAGELDALIPCGVVRLGTVTGRSIKEILKNRKAGFPGELLQYIKYRIMLLLGYSVCESAPRLRGNYDIAVAYDDGKHIPDFVAKKVTAAKKIMFFHYGKIRKETAKKDEKIFSSFDSIVLVSDTIREAFVSAFPALAEKTITAHNMIAGDEIIKEADENAPDIIAEAGEQIIVTVGRFTPDKGVDLAIRTAKQLKQNNKRFRWLLIGNGPLFQPCQELIRELEVSDCCFLIGAQTNPYSYMKRADLYVQPSRVESEGLTVREAMILGVPVLASDIPAFKETVGTYGALVPLNENAFAAAISELLERQPCCVDTYDWQRRNEQTKKLLRQLLFDQ